MFRGLPSWAFKRGGICVGGCYLTGDGVVSDRVLAHEAVHARQWRRYGLLMPLLYLFAGSDPLRNRFEIEAGLEDGNYVPPRGRLARSTAVVTALRYGASLPARSRRDERRLQTAFVSLYCSGALIVSSGMPRRSVRWSTMSAVPR